MPYRRATVRVPATSANLGPGFDCLGMALDLWAEATVTALDEPAAAPESPLLATVHAAALALYAAAGLSPPPGLSVAWEGDIPVARGLGASAAARAAGLLAANALCGEPLARDELLALGARLEGHADNMAPALFGGLQVVVWDGETVVRVGLAPPTGVWAVLFVPDVAMPTDESRRLLPSYLSREDAVHNIGRAALLVAALAAGRLEALDAATQDRLHQPARAQLFPAMYDLFEAARGAGALCAYLSGGGSSVLALTAASPEGVGQAMQEAAGRRGVGGRVIVTVPSGQGAEVIGCQ
ncbi:MAG: homoserine kinase [Dehalococcoidia bacterium]